MCGRFCQIFSEMKFPFLYNNFAKIQSSDNYNITPGHLVPVLLLSRKSQEIECHKLQWGLVPHWASDESIALQLMNARSETIDKKPSFKEAFIKRRCLIPITGFYEWDTKTKQPYYITSTYTPPVFLAGIWDRWKSPDNRIILSFTIITKAALNNIEHIHHRMPVVISHKHVKKWLSSSTPVHELKELFTDEHNPNLTPKAISQYVNDPQNNDKQCLEDKKEEAFSLVG